MRSRPVYGTARQPEPPSPWIHIARVFGLADHEAAAGIRRACRAGGETVRSTMDRLIAAVAIRERAHVLHRDRDFDVIARHTDLRLLYGDRGHA